MLNSTEISSRVDRMAEIKRQIAVLKSESDGIEAELLKQFEADVEDTKYRTVKYSGNGASVIANYADKVALVYPSMLKKIFGEAYGDVVTEEVSYKLSANAKRLLATLYKKDYMQGATVEAALQRIAPDDKTLKVMLKRIKGKNFDSDKNNLVKLAGLEENRASDYAFMISEAAAWQEFERLLAASGGVTEERIAEVLEYINAAITVEETPKITVTE